KLLAETQAWIDDLRARELALKRRGRWQSSDLLRHTADRQRAIDRLVYPAKHFDDVAEIDELVRAEIAGGSVAIVCRSTAGIYEVERQLRRLHGRRLGVIALQRDAATYSLRQVDPYLPASLEKVYAHLNLIDPAAGGHRSGNRWAGSADIGGSPRGSGTRVAPEQIARACEQAFSAPTFLRRLGRIASAALRSTSVMIAALALACILRLLDDRIGLESGIAPSLASQFPMLLLGFGGAFFFLRGRRAPGIYGLRRFAGLDWCLVLPRLPIALTQSMLGGPAPALGALVFGVAAGMARERSESIVSPILLHWIGIAVVLLARAGCM